MATITNQATLSYNGVTVTSNVATGEILDEISASKTALREIYGAGDEVTYVSNIVNSGTADATGVTVTDDLGAYEFGEETLYPLTYVDGTVRLFSDGVLQSEPAVAAGPPLSVSGITVPAEGNVTLIYSAAVNSFAPLGTGAAIENTATVDGSGITPVTASETVSYSGEPRLSVTKSIAPQILRAGGSVTYSFVIGNSGEAATEEDGVMITDAFDPILSGLSVTLDGAPLEEGSGYTYDSSTGLFETVEGVITVPGAAYSQGADGSWKALPGETVLTVSGTIA